MHFTSLELSQQLYEVSKWDNNASYPHQIEKVWMPGYHLSMMGEGNPDYMTTPPNERNKVEVGGMKITDDPRHRLGIPEVVFEWWYREVKELEKQIIPAYDLGFMRKAILGGLSKISLLEDEYAVLIARLATALVNGENRTCEFAIELFKQNILKKETN